MKWCVFAIVLAAGHAYAQTPGAHGAPDLGGAGVWLPRQVKDIGANAQVPFQPWSKQKFVQNREMKGSETDLRCLPPGVPRIMLMARPFEIVQTPKRIMFVFEGGAHVWRQVWMDGRAHPKDPNPNWLGDSIGHWEGGTLVVDTVGFNDKTWLDDAGHPHSEQLHVIERLTRTRPMAIKYEAEIDDPGAYTQPWKFTNTFSYAPSGRLAEDICLDKIAP